MFFTDFAELLVYFFEIENNDLTAIQSPITRGDIERKGYKMSLKF